MRGVHQMCMQICLRFPALPPSAVTEAGEGESLREGGDVTNDYSRPIASPKCGNVQPERAQCP